MLLDVAGVEVEGLKLPREGVSFELQCCRQAVSGPFPLSQLQDWIAMNERGRKDRWMGSYEVQDRKERTRARKASVELQARSTKSGRKLNCMAAHLVPVT